VPVVPTKGLTISVPAAPWPDAVKSAVMDHSRLFGLIRIGDDMRVSGSAEITGYDTMPSDRRCDAIIANALELFPDFCPMPRGRAAAPLGGPAWQFA
jgi:D-amino-acid dehydrogenase